jgi:tetratricopeptide (TPR) repeat protein
MKKLLLLALGVLFFVGCPATWENSAKIYMQKGMYEEAKAQAMIGTQQIPTPYRAYCLLAQAELGLGNSLAATKAFRDGMKVDSTLTMQWIINDKNNTSLYWQTFYNSAVAETGEKKYNDALANLEICILIDPNNVNEYVLDGLIYGELGNKEAAGAAYKKALEIDPQNPEPYFRIGMSYFEKKLYDTSLVYFEKAVKQYSVGYENSKKVVFQNVPFDKGVGLKIYSLSSAKKNDELDQLIKKILGFDNGLAGQSRNIEKFVKAADGLSRAYYFTGITYYNEQKDTIALNNLTASLDLNGEDIDALFFSGEILVKFQKWTEAKERFEKVTSIKDDDVVAWFYIGVCYMQLKDYKKAISVYEDKVLKYDPKNLDALTNLAISYRELGDTKKAMEYLQKKEQIIKGQ